MRAASPPAYPRIIERIWILGLDIADVFGCIKQDVERELHVSVPFLGLRLPYSDLHIA
jgi:hypothetical protein